VHDETSQSNPPFIPLSPFGPCPGFELFDDLIDREGRRTLARGEILIGLEVLRDLLDGRNDQEGVLSIIQGW
jgi:hypothetical protein